MATSSAVHDARSVRNAAKARGAIVVVVVVVVVVTTVTRQWPLLLGLVVVPILSDAVQEAVKKLVPPVFDCGTCTT